MKLRRYKKCAIFGPPCKTTITTTITTASNTKIVKQLTLTVLLVEQYLDLLLFVVLETGVDTSDRLAVRKFTGHERTVGAFLHQLGATVPAQLTEPVVTVDGRVVDHSRVGQHETAVCNSHTNIT